MNNQRTSRITAAAVLATSLVAAFATLGGVGIAKGAISAVQYQYGPKVTICHKGKTVTIGKSAVPAHVRNHGDTIGSCSSEAAKAKKAKHAKAEHAKKAKHAKAEAEKSSDLDREKPGKDKGHSNGK